MFQKSNRHLGCLNETFPEGVYTLNLPYPLGTSFLGHPDIFLDCPFSFSGKLGVARPNLVDLGQETVNLGFDNSHRNLSSDLSNQDTQLLVTARSS